MTNCGLTPCECKLPRCPVCNYTKHDAETHGDHRFPYCKGTIPTMTNRDMALSIFEMCKHAKDQDKTVEMVERLLNFMCDETHKAAIDRVSKVIKTVKRSEI